MKRKKLISSILLIMLFSISFVLSTQAESTGSVTVTYYNEKNERCSVVITSMGDGKVVVGKEAFKNESRKYLIMRDESMTVKLYPEPGASVESVLFNDTEIKDQIKNNRLIIEGHLENQELKVTFTTLSKFAALLPKTGDDGNLLLYGCLSFFALIGIVLMTMKKHGRNHKGEK